MNQPKLNGNRNEIVFNNQINIHKKIRKQIIIEKPNLNENNNFLERSYHFTMDQVILNGNEIYIKRWYLRSSN